MTKLKHNLIIHEAAKRILGGIGLNQKNSKRLWLDDNGWFAILVQLPPRPNSIGTSLSIGIHFHWYVQSLISSDLGKAENNFIHFRDEDVFAQEIELLLLSAQERILHFRQEFLNFETAQQIICDHSFGDNNLWGPYHKGTICGLNGDHKNMIRYYEQVTSSTNDNPWAVELKTRTTDLLHLSSDPIQFKNHIHNVIQTSRKVKNLGSYEVNNLER